MSGDLNIVAIGIFAAFVLFVIGLSFYLGNKTKSASGYFAAGGQISWQVNGISFAGDYLSAASFLGICGMIATVGYDGFLYSIGYLAGWIVALFVVAEPMKRLGKYTFTDALDAKFNSRGIKLTAAISTLIVSIFYLIPQMVGAGILVTPLLGLEHMWGVIMVGVIVILIVATAGMASTTYVQFLKGALLIVFSTVLVICVCVRGISTDVERGGIGDAGAFVPETLAATMVDDTHLTLADDNLRIIEQHRGENTDILFVKIGDVGAYDWYSVKAAADGDGVTLTQCQWEQEDAEVPLVNGEENGELSLVGRVTAIDGMTAEEAHAGTGALDPFSFIGTLSQPGTVFEQWPNDRVDAETGSVKLYYQRLKPGDEVMKPGVKFKVAEPTDKLVFISLMLALFCGTAALPHILIRYYTVPSPAAARKSTILAIAAIGFFYVLTLFLGLGGAINGTLNPANGNMAAPLLANSFGSVLFAIISAIAFATVLGTVSGLIVASSGAIAHDLLDRWARIDMGEKGKVLAGKLSALGVGVIAIVLGILFEHFNVSFLVGWAFAVAASANLPAIVMLLFWKRTTAAGIVASIVVGIVAALGIILTGPDVCKQLYGMATTDAWHPLGQPGIVSIPLSFATLVVVSLLTQPKQSAAA